jgi:phosphoribosylformylglycinamidine synthase
VVVFPGSNCDRDAAVALERATGKPTEMAWHGDTDLASVDLIVLPGGFSYGDYLRSGAMAARSPIMTTVIDRAKKGIHVLGICNGFQVLTETGLLPGALLPNAGLKFVCRPVSLRVENAASVFTGGYLEKQVIRAPVAHHDGNYFADPETHRMLVDENRIAFRYCAPDPDGLGAGAGDANPNGSLDDIAGLFNDTGTVLGMMPHPERVVEPVLGGTDGGPLFEHLVSALS